MHPCSYYYYQTEPNKTYEDTLLDVHAYAQAERIPYRYILLDSWWCVGVVVVIFVVVVIVVVVVGVVVVVERGGGGGCGVVMMYLDVV